MITQLALEAPEASTKQIALATKTLGISVSSKHCSKKTQGKWVDIPASNSKTSAINKTHFFNTEICTLYEEL